MAACSGSDDDLGLGGGSKSSSDNNSTTNPPPDDPLVPASGGLRRLLARQYVNSVRSIFGDVGALAAKPPNDTSLHGFDNIGAAELALPEAAVEVYEQSARDVAMAVIEDPATLDQVLPCTPTGADDVACHQAFITQAGRLAWRRPLDEHETTLLVNIAQAAATEYGRFEIGVAYAISGLLQSPYFLYSTEIGEPDPADATRRKLTSYELATRMSFFLLDTTPDAALLDKVETGGFATDADVRQVATEMLAKPAARAALANFYSELFRLREIDTIHKDAALFPQFTPALAKAMKQETLELINEVVWVKNGDAREMFSADYAFVNAGLAALYNVPAPQAGFKKTVLPAEQKRAGLLGSAGFLARFAHPGTTSPTRRGLFVKTALLCEDIPPPPPGVSTQFPPDDPTKPKTMKQKLEAHMNNAECHQCHGLMDPIGFALENFDPIGSFRVADKGIPIDSTGEVPGLGAFASARDLATILTEDPRGASCVIRNLFRNSMGHLETIGEMPAIRDLEGVFAEKGYRVQDLLVELVASPAFQLVGEPK